MTTKTEWNTKISRTTNREGHKPSRTPNRIKVSPRRVGYQTEWNAKPSGTLTKMGRLAEIVINQNGTPKPRGVTNRMINQTRWRTKQSGTPNVM